MARNATSDLSRELGTDIQLEDLHPKTFIRKHLLSEEDEAGDPRRPLDDAYAATCRQIATDVQRRDGRRRPPRQPAPRPTTAARRHRRPALDGDTAGYGSAALATADATRLGRPAGHRRPSADAERRPAVSGRRACRPERLADQRLPAHGQPVGDRAQRHRGRGVRVGQHDRRAGVAGLADPGVQRDLAEQRHRARRSVRVSDVGHRLRRRRRRRSPSARRRAAPARTCSRRRRPGAGGSAARSRRPARPPRRRRPAAW